MKSLFDENDAKEFITEYPTLPQDLALRIYTSRLIGGDTNLDLHGGGNTSVKLKMRNIVGEEQEILYVKGSGIDLATIEPKGFVGLNLNFLRKLRNLESLSDEELENQLQIHKVSAQSSDPSVEALLHAFLLPRYIDHTHADSILILTNRKCGEDLVKEALGSKIAVLPYISSGFPLAKAVLELYERNNDIEAILILNHGIFTFSEDGRTSYERMIDYVSRAELYIEKMIKGKVTVTPHINLKFPKNFLSSAARFAQVVRGACAHQAFDGKLRRFYTEIRRGEDIVRTSLSKEAQEICSSGVLTPDHVIWTKNRAVYIEGIPENDHDFR